MFHLLKKTVIPNLSLYLPIINNVLLADQHLLVNVAGGVSDVVPTVQIDRLQKFREQLVLNY